MILKAFNFLVILKVLLKVVAKIFCLRNRRCALYQSCFVQGQPHVQIVATLLIEEEISLAIVV